MATTAGAGSLIIGVLLVVLGLTMWFQAVARVFAGVATIMLSLVSLVVSNIGGFLMGFLLGLIGGALAVAWGPGARPVEDPEHPSWLPKLDEPAHEEAAQAAEHTAEANGRNSAG
jgi:hypothetical protein